MKRINSKDNQIIKHIKKLKIKKYRDQYNQYIVEGLKIIEEAKQEKVNIKYLIINENKDIKDEIIEESQYEAIGVPENIFNDLAEVKSPQGVLAVIEKEKKQDIDYNEDIIVAIDGLQDPGNIGTILRTVDSVGLKQILISKNTVDCYNPKVVRSTMGAIFRVNIIECEDMVNSLKQAQNNNYKIMVTKLDAKKNIYEVQYNKKVIVIGNEANGVSDTIKQMADESVLIPMFGKTESLNASVACSVILYEYVRQKIASKI